MCNSSTLATATIAPAPASSTGLVSSACISMSAAIFTPLRAPTTGTVESFFSVPEYTRMKFNFCTKGSMRVLKTWATSGPAGSDLISTASPAAFVAARLTRVGGNAQMAKASSNSGKPAPDLADTHITGISALRPPLWVSAGQVLPRWAACLRNIARSRPHPLR